MSECPICFNKANYTTTCEHTFCKKCLFRWGNSCPLCRKHIILDYPNTRAMSKRPHVMESAVIILKNIERVDKKIDKLNFAEKLFILIWDNRIIIRKYRKLCKIIHKKSLHIERECKNMGVLTPKIIKKTMTI